MFADIARQTLQRSRHVDQHGDFFFLLVKLEQRFFLLQRLVERHTDLEWHQLGDAVDETVGMRHDAPDITDYRLRGHAAVGDDLRHLVATVVFSDVIDDLVAPIHAEIDVEVRHGNAFRVEETLEQ